MKQIMGCMRPYWKTAVAAAVFMLLDVAAEILQPMLMAAIVDDGVMKGDLRTILVIGGLMILFSLLAVGAGIGNAKFASKAGVGFAANVRKSLFDKVQTFSFKNIDHFSTASLSTRLTNDVTQMQNTAIMGLRILIRAPLMLIFATIMAIRISSSLAVILAVILPVLIILISLIMSRAMGRFEAMQKAVDRVNGGVQENLTNVRVVKSFVREEFEKEKFKEANDGLMHAAMRAVNLIIIAMPAMMLIMNVSILSVLWFGGNQVIAGAMEVGTMSAFINYIFLILMSLMMVSMVFIMISRASASFKRGIEVLKAEADITDKEDAIPARRDEIKGHVEFKNVSFKYNEDAEENILEDISFKAEPGTVLAVIGGTGAGKTSLVQLIPRLYDVTEGQVLLDGKDVRDYTMESLREAVGMVLQKNTLFSGTIRDNLKWGNENAADEEIIQAAKNASAHDFIESFTEGYDTWIEQGGVNVSGGQKQRLCIARAMLKKPAILILDDSTSAVDTATESRIRKAFYNDLKDTTMILIAQRITSVMDADKIIVLDDGRIAAEGTHEELLKISPEYQEIYESQMGKEVAS